jgi:hypothetical protein
MIEVLQRLQQITNNEHIPNPYFTKRRSEYELVQKQRKEENLYKHIDYYNVISNYQAEVREAIVIPLSLNKRTNSKQLRKYSCPEQIKKLAKDNILAGDCLDRDSLLINRILEIRKQAKLKIVSFFLKVKKMNQLKQEMIVKYILQERQRKAVLIQKTFRMFSVRKNFNEILTAKLNDHIFIYNYIDNNNLNSTGNQIYNKKIQLKIKARKNKTDTILDFVYSKPLSTHYLILKNLKFLKRSFKVNFIVNDKIIIDSRFQVDCEDGQFYNIITSDLLIKPTQKQKTVKVYHKAWEKAFEITNSERDTNSVSDISVSEQLDIDRFLKRVVHWTAPGFKATRKAPAKPILRKAKSDVIKKVSFSDKELVFNY